MTYSFIGIGKPISAFNNILQNHIKAYRKSKFGKESILTAGGIFASNLSAAAKFAGDNDMCVYMSLGDLIEKSDIIFIFLSDKALKNISVNLGKHYPKGKIFCHFSPAFSADILDFNSSNTYLSLFLPYITKDEKGNSTSDCIIAQGYGKNLDTFNELMNKLSIKLSFVSPEEKIMFHTAVNIAKDMPLILNYTAQRLMKYALASDKSLSDELISMISNNPTDFISYDTVENEDTDFALRQCSILKSLAIDDITNLYSSLLGISAQIHGNNEFSQQIDKITKKVLKTK